MTRIFPAHVFGEKPDAPVMWPEDWKMESMYLGHGWDSIKKFIFLNSLLGLIPIYSELGTPEQKIIFYFFLFLIGILVPKS